MKIDLTSARTQRQSAGSAVIVIIVLLAMLLIYIGANIKSLHYLNRELKLIERQQTNRLHATTIKAAQAIHTEQGQLLK